MLREEDRKRIETRLLAERAQVLEAIGRFDEGEQNLRERLGELSMYDQHPADIGTEAQERETEFLLASVEGRRLYDIDEALQRLYRSPETFGRCEVCGRGIEPERLDVIPETRVCAEHARQADAEAN